MSRSLTRTVSTRNLKPAPRPRRHIVAILVFTIYAALLPVDRLLLADSAISTPVWRGYILFLILCLIGRRASIPAFPGVWISALILIPLGGAISGLTTNISSSLLVAVQLALIVGLSPFVLRYYVANSRAFIWSVGASFVLSQTVSSIAGIMQLSGIQVLDTKLIFGRATGLAGHPNVLGFMSVIAIVACLAAILKMPRPLRALALIAAAINGYTLVFSGSLSAMLAGVAAVAIALAIARKLVLAFVVVVLGSAALTFTAYGVGLDAGGILDPVSNRLDVVLGMSTVEGGAASVDTRILTYEWAWRFISSNPLVGVGMDSRFAGTYNGVTPVHNYILHAWYRGGLFFFAWQVAATIAYIALVVRALREKAPVAATALLVAMVTFASTSAFYDQEAYWLPLLLAVACFPRRRTSDVGSIPLVRGDEVLTRNVSAQ